MMCEHEWIELKWSYIFGQKSPSPRTLKKFRTVCKRCDATPREIELEQQLAAANVRIIKADEQWEELRLKAEKEFQRAEKAEAQCADAMDKIAMQGAEIVRLSDGKAQADENLAWLLQAYCDECDYDSEICRGTHPEMRCAARALDDSKGAAIITRMHRMEEALRRCGLCKDYSHANVKCYHDAAGYRPPQATCNHPEAGFRLVDWLEVPDVKVW